MRESYLEVTFRRGRALAAYYYLPRRPGQKSYRTREVVPGILVDFGRGGRPIGIEITAPERASVTTINRILRQLRQPPLRSRDLAPLHAA